MRPEIFQRYVVLLLMTTLSKAACFKFLRQYLLILQHLLMRYFWKHYDQAEDMVRIASFCWDYQMDLSFATHEAALLKLEVVQKLFHIDTISFQFC